MTLMASCLTARAVAVSILEREEGRHEPTQSQNGQGVAENIVLGRKDVNKANQEDHPDEDIGHNSCGQAMSMHGNSSVPEQGR